MKQTRKVLSFVLILALVMGSFSMVFAAGTTKSNAATLSDIAGLIGEDQIEVCQNLGIIQGMPDGTFEPQTLVNRAQFAAIITRALGIPESALAGYATSTFKDTAGYGWAIPYLAFCQSKGIMVGDGQGNAMPGRTITVNEAITMILRSLGYVDSAADLVGVWPANYVTLGKALKLYDDIANDVNMDRENAAIAIYNALTVQLVSIDADGKTNFRYVPNTSYAGYAGDPLTLANSGLACDTWANRMIVPSDFGNSLINITNKIGAVGTVYTNRDGELVAFSPNLHFGFVTGTIDGDKLKTDAGSKYVFSQNAGQLTSAAFFMNAGDSAYEAKSYAGSTSSAAVLIKDFIKAQETDGEEVTVAAELSGLTIKHIHAIVGWQATDVNMISSGEVNSIKSDKSILGTDFALNDDQDIDEKQFALVGAKSLDDIKVDNVVYVYVDADKHVHKVAVGQEVVEGTIDEIDAGKFVMGGKTYELADEYLTLAGKTTKGDIESEAGATAVVNLDAYGYAYKVDTTGGETGQFAMVVGAEPSTTTKNAEAKLYTNDDAEKTLVFVKNSKVDVYAATATASKKATVDFEEKVLTPGKTTDLLSKNLVGYRLNSDGYINRIDLAVAADGKDKAGMLTVKSKTVLNDSVRGDITIAKDAAVFTYDDKKATYETRDKADYNLSSLTNIDLAKSKNTPVAGQYVLNAKGDKVVALLLPATIADADSDDIYAVLNTIGTTKEGGDKVLILRGYSDGTALQINTTTDVTSNTFDLEEIGLYMLTKNGNGKVKTAKEVVQSGATSSRAIHMNAVAQKNPIDGNNIKLNAGIATVSDDVKVYKAEWKSGTSRYEYSLSSINSIKENFRVWMYNTADKDGDVTQVASVVIYVAADKVKPAPAQATDKIAFQWKADGTAGGDQAISTSETVAVAVNNDVKEVIIKLSNAKKQTLETSGTDAALVAISGDNGDENRTLTVNTTDIAEKGGSKTFTITVSEEGKTSIVYTVTITVADPVEEPVVEPIV